MTLTLERLNSASRDDATQLLYGLYENSQWIAEESLNERPFKSWAHLKFVMCQVLARAGRDAQLSLICAYPELADETTVCKTFKAGLTDAQAMGGLTDCASDEYSKIQKLNANYKSKFGWPFILALRGPRGTGYSQPQIIEIFERRLQGHPDFEWAECLRNVHRIAEIRLNDKLDVGLTLGHQVWDWQERLAQHSDAGHAEKGQLTVTYLTDAHRACAQRISHWMKDCGFDEVEIDAVGNVVGRYHPAAANGKYLLTGSHYDTVRDGGKYDGRLGIFVPMACIQELYKQGKRLPFGIEVVAFSEEEGQRYKATFLGSGALIGDFHSEWLEQQDADGITMRTALQHAGLCIDDIPKIQRDPSKYLGFVEVHIEQGPVLNEMNIPLGVVTSINGSVRYLCEVVGMASHAGTTPMDCRRDAVCAVAELALYMEKRATGDDDSVATMGQLQVLNGSVNVVPGQCTFTLDMRAPTDGQRDALESDVLAALAVICERRGLSYTVEETMRAASAPSAPELQAHWEKAVTALGVPIFKLPSGAGHDAMKLHEVMPQAMLFVRGENAGISHNRLESTTSDDMQLCVDTFTHVLKQIATEAA